jgi:hypothetical protein
MTHTNNDGYLGTEEIQLCMYAWGDFLEKQPDLTTGLGCCLWSEVESSCSRGLLSLVCS